MRALGWLLVGVGCLVALVAFSMDTTVALSDGTGRVHNIGLMKSQDRTLTIGGLMLLIGVLVLLFGKKTASVSAQSATTRACPYCAEQIQPTAVICRFCNREVAPTVELSHEQRMQALGIQYKDGMYWVGEQSHYKLSEAVNAAQDRGASKTSES